MGNAIGKRTFAAMFAAPALVGVSDAVLLSAANGYESANGGWVHAPADHSDGDETAHWTNYEMFETVSGKLDWSMQELRMFERGCPGEERMYTVTKILESLKAKKPKQDGGNEPDAAAIAAFDKQVDNAIRYIDAEVAVLKAAAEKGIAAINDIAADRTTHEQVRAMATQVMVSKMEDKNETLALIEEEKAQINALRSAEKDRSADSDETANDGVNPATELYQNPWYQQYSKIKRQLRLSRSALITLQHEDYTTALTIVLGSLKAKKPKNAGANEPDAAAIAAFNKEVDDAVTAVDAKVTVFTAALTDMQELVDGLCARRLVDNLASVLGKTQVSSFPEEVFRLASKALRNHKEAESDILPLISEKKAQIMALRID